MTSCRHYESSRTQTDRISNQLISTSVHYVHLGRHNYLMVNLRTECKIVDKNQSTKSTASIKR